MTDQPAEEAHRTGRSVRLDTLVRLRWLAVIGQTTAVLVVYFGLDYELPIWGCLAVIALAAWLNVALRIRFPMTQRLEPDRAAWLLAFDIAELAVLLFFTGGLQNPFAFLFLGPVLISATALPPRMTLMLGGFAIACATLLVFVHDPLPWDTEPPLELPAVYVMGVWLSILLSIAFIGLHAWQITEESRQLADALAATELVLAREQHLSQLDGLAAAAAHELGTPLATITLIAKELQLAITPDSEHADDVRLLNEQAKRCRAILAKLTELSSGDPFDRMKLSTLIEEVVAPHRDFGVAINVALSAGDVDEPVGGRNPAILYGLETCWRTPSTSPASGSTSRPPGADRTSLSPSPTMARALLRRSWTESASLTSPAAGNNARASKARRAASGSASSLQRRCWSARVRRSISRTAPFRTGGRSCACTGDATTSSAPWRSLHKRKPVGYRMSAVRCGWYRARAFH